MMLMGLPKLSYAEYRAYELRIVDAIDSTEYRVMTTLDPFQYTGYYPLRKSQKISLLDSWMCRGNTSDHKPLCPSPRASSVRPRN